MEFFDIYNNDGSSAEYTASRNDAHRNGLWHKTVHVWIVNNKGNLLLQKRSIYKETFPGFWDISCAGHIDAGESSLEAAIRELREELGVIATKNELQFLFAIRQCYYKENPLVIDNEFADVFLLNNPRDIDNMSCNDEVTDLKFVDILELIDGSLVNVAEHGEEYLKLQEFFASPPAL
jgi:isopentenyl-diphosphate delta-isomerase